MLDDLMIVYPDSLTKTKQIQDPGPGEYYLRFLKKHLRVQLFFLLWNRFMDSGTRVISFWTRIHGFVGGYPESKTIPRTRPITNT